MCCIYHDLSTHNLLDSYWKWAFIVDLLTKNGDFPLFFVCLPGGIYTSGVAPRFFFAQMISTEGTSLFGLPIS